MHFATIAASAALVGSAIASGSYYETTAYHTQGGQVYTSVSTCTEQKPKPTAPVYGSVPVYKPTTPAAVPHTTPAGYGSYQSPTPYAVTYTSHSAVVYGGHTYSSAVYSVSTCTGGYNGGHPTTTPAGYAVPTTPSGYGSYSSVPYVPYQAPKNTTTPCTTAGSYQTTPVGYGNGPSSVPYGGAPPSGPVTYTHTYYTTVCPGPQYCYGTTATSLAPYPPTGVPSKPTGGYATPSSPAGPVYTPPTGGNGGYPSTPSKNSTTPYPTQPPTYNNGAATTTFSIGAAVVAALAVFIAA